MRRVALKGLWWRRGRAVLTAFAVVLGVAMVSGTFILTDTINKAFDTIFQDSYSKTSAVISGREVVKDAASGNATVPASLLRPRARQRQRRGGHGRDLQPQRHLRPDQAHRQGRQARWARARTGSSASASTPSAERFNPLSLTAGRWASGPGQVVIDKGTATGQRLRRRRPDRRGRPRPGAAVHDHRHRPLRHGQLDRRRDDRRLRRPHRAGAAGQARAVRHDLRRRPRRRLLRAARARPAAARAGRRAGQDRRSSRPTPTPRTPRSSSKFVQYFLLGFGFIALGVGAFVIFNTLSITLAQRIRELATLRTLGASRRQIKRSVLTEGLVMGVFASVVGLVLGLGAGEGPERALPGVRHRPARRPRWCIEPRTIIVALGAGHRRSR